MELLLEEVSFNAPEISGPDRSGSPAAYVDERLKGVVGGPGPDAGTSCRKSAVQRGRETAENRRRGTKTMVWRHAFGKNLGHPAAGDGRVGAAPERHREQHRQRGHAQLQAERASTSRASSSGPWTARRSCASRSAITDDRHIAFDKPMDWRDVAPRRVLDYLTEAKNNGNNVDIEEEGMDVAQQPAPVHHARPGGLERVPARQHRAEVGGDDAWECSAASTPRRRGSRRRGSAST